MPPITFGRIISLLVLVAVVVLALTGQLGAVLALLIGALALSILVP